ncbi:unnamed protein product, partial [Allacma fusca]
MASKSTDSNVKATSRIIRPKLA